VTEWNAIARRIRVPIGFVFSAVYLWLARPTPLSLAIGAAIVLPGLMIRALASGHVKKNEQLTTSGPYAYTRNPLYLGSLVIGGGFAVAARSWWIVSLMALIFGAIYVPVIRSEELYLKSRFSEFAGYAEEVPRFLPRLSAARPAKQQQGGFSWELYRKHREYNAIVGSCSVMAVLIAKWLWASR